DHVLPVRELEIHEVRRRSVHVPEDLGPLEELTACRHLRESIVAHERVVTVVELPGTRGTRGRRYGENEPFGISGKQLLHDAALADAGGAGDHDQAPWALRQGDAVTA